jgi:hypothetical protein
VYRSQSGKTIAIPNDFVGKFTNAIENLHKNSYVKLMIPDNDYEIDDRFLDQVIDSLTINISDYKTSLELGNNPDDNKVNYNNLLRISYTFSDEIVRFIRLIISISDLKPIIFWLTSYEKYKFSFEIKKLPWEKIGGKADLSNYINTIKSARNKAFHNLLQFNQTIDVQMENVTIKPLKLRFFSEYKSKENIFDYEDRELIEILTEFTRSGERYVAYDFWKRNLSVMESSLELITAISNSLKLLI